MELDFVSRETRTRLEAYVLLLKRWTQAINLVSDSTLDDPWTRHILDSAQLFPLLGTTDLRLVDLGSGAGFPGLVLAIMGVKDVHLIEADQRKAAFLREVARLTQTRVTIHRQRIETVEDLPAQVVTARACAPLPVLCGYAARFLTPDGVGLFLKGKQVDGELTAAAKEWKMKTQVHPSATDRLGIVLQVRGLSPL